MPHRNIRPEVLDVLPMAVVRHLGRLPAPVMRRVLLANVLGVVLVLLYGLWSGDLSQFWASIAFLLLFGYCYWQLHQKKSYRAFAVFCWGLLGLTGLVSVFIAGVRTPMLVLVPCLIMLAAWALGRAQAIGMVLVTVAMLVLLVVAEYAGWLPAPQARSPVQVLITYLQLVIMVAALAMTLTTNMQELLATSAALSESLELRLQRLAADKQSLKGTAQWLEEQVQDRSAQLRQTIAKLEQALDLTHSGLWTLDLQQPQPVVVASARTQALLGLPARGDHQYSSREWLRQVQLAADARTVQLGLQFSRSIAAGHIDRYELEYPFLRPADGQVVWLRQVVTLERSGQGVPLRLLGVLTDITASHQAEEALKASNLLSTTALKMVDAGSWSCDFVNQPRYTLLSVEAAAIVGYPAGAPYAMPDSEWRRSVAGADVLTLDTHSELMRRMASGEISHYDMVYQRVRWRDGSRRWNRVVSHAVRDRDGNLTGLIGVIMDVTDAKRSELDLQQTKAAAETSARAKSDFLANMSHEIRTPLNAIAGLSSLAMRMEMPPRLQDYLLKIQRSGEHLLALVNNVLDFSKIESGRLEVESIAFSLPAVMNKVVALNQDSAQKKGLQLHATLDPQLPAAFLGDPLRIEQVLINLVSNAVKFTSQGEIRMRVEHLGTHDGSTTVRFSVSDDGIGLSEAQLGRLFQSFAQGDASITRQFGGSGLGLAISKGLVERMGGQIGVNSTQGMGATFWFSLRLCAASEQDTQTLLGTQASSAHVLAPEVARMGGARVLVVEDNAINQQVVAEILRNAGLWVEVADDGQMGCSQVRLRQQEGQPYDLVLMDMQMPVMDGLTTTGLLRQTHSAQSLPILALTANAQPHDHQRCLEAGMNDFIIKPIDQGVLWQKLMQWMPLRPHMGPVALPQRTPNAAAQAALDALQGLPGLDVRLGLARTSGEVDFYCRLLQQFVQQHSNAAQQVGSALAQADTEQAVRLAHSLKASSGNLGAYVLQESAAALEKGLREQADATAIAALLHHTQLQIGTLVDGLLAHPYFAVGAQAASFTAPLARSSAQELAQARAVVAELHDLLHESDAQAVDLWAAHSDLLVRVLPQGQQVGQAVVEYNFSRALALLDTFA